MVGTVACSGRFCKAVLQPCHYSERLGPEAGSPAPAVLRRAEGFMRAHAGEPLRMKDVAAAAGCSARTLNNLYARFRDTTPLAALHAVRLDCLREALLSSGDVAVATLAQRYGFTNGARLAKAYGRRFGERPSETAKRRGGRHDAGPAGHDPAGAARYGRTPSQEQP